MRQFIKGLLFGTGVQQKQIVFGLARNIKMRIDLNHKSQRYLGLDEREVQPSFRRYANLSSVFVDIGASDGYYGLIYHKLNNKGEIFLCDADPSYAPQQKAHFLMNNFSLNKVNFISKFISDITNETHIALDNLLKNADDTIFLKIDVDGGELHVLKGVEKVLTQNDCKLIVETHSKELEDKCTAYLQGLGYKSAIIPNAWWRLFVPEKRPIEHNRWFNAEKNKLFKFS